MWARAIPIGNLAEWLTRLTRIVPQRARSISFGSACSNHAVVVLLVLSAAVNGRDGFGRVLGGVVSFVVGWWDVAGVGVVAIGSCAIFRGCGSRLGDVHLRAGQPSTRSVRSMGSARSSLWATGRARILAGDSTPSCMGSEHRLVAMKSAETRPPPSPTLISLYRDVPCESRSGKRELARDEHSTPSSRLERVIL